MKVEHLSPSDLRRYLAKQGLVVRLGPFSVRIHSTLSEIADSIHTLYKDIEVLESPQGVDFHVSAQPSTGVRRFYRRQVHFDVDGRPPFEPLPLSQAFPTLEWGINWCIAMRANHLFMMHAAAVEKNGLAVVMPAWPGSGKTTLCTALVHSGWRLLSDEFGLMRPDDGLMVALPRPLPLKNQSIEVIREFLPDAFIGPSFEKTKKGTVAHVRPPAESVERGHETAKPAWIVFPRWQAGSPLSLEPLSKHHAFLGVATNSFNYEILGATAFSLAAHLVDSCDCFNLTYSNLQEAIAAFDRLASDHGPG